MLVIGFDDYRRPAQVLAEHLKMAYAEAEIHHFPDGESRLSINTDLPEEVIICRSLDRPNDKLIELLLLCSHLRQQQVQQITLVAPYLCYMRQDMAFHPGEVVSQAIIAEFISQHVDRLITVDPHLHRVSRLSDAYPDIRTTSLSARDLIVDFLRQQSRTLLLMGPDRESEQWVSTIADAAGLKYVIADKVRHGDREVVIKLPDQDYKHQSIMLIDDVISTGHTLAKITRLLQQQGAANIACIVTHPLFSQGAMDTLMASGITQVISTDTIIHHSNKLSMINTIAEAINK